MYENDIPTPPSTVRLPQVSFLQTFKNLKAFPLLSIICQTLFESFTVHTHVSHLFSALISGQGIKQATKTKKKKTSQNTTKTEKTKIHQNTRTTKMNNKNKSSNQQTNCHPPGSLEILRRLCRRSKTFSRKAKALGQSDAPSGV